MSKQGPSESPLAASTSGLRRGLTGRQLSMIGLGSAIGTGLFLGSGLAISVGGPSVILAYVACALVALVLAWALAEMAVVHPTAGGFGALAGSYIGKWAGFVVRWTYWAALCINIGGEVIAAGIFVKFWWPSIPLWLTTVVFAAALILVNASTVGVFGKSEYWFSMIKVAAIVVFIILGALLIFVGLPGKPATGVTNLTSHGGFFPHGMTGLLLAMAFVFFSFIGTEAVSVTSAESKNPVRDVRRATSWMVVRLALFYIVAITVVLMVIPWTQTAQVGNDITASPFVLVFKYAGIPAAATVMNLVVLTAAISSANAQMYLSTRMLHSLAENRYAPRWAGRINSHGVPALALILSSFGLLVAGILSVVAANTAYLAIFGISVFSILVVWLFILVTHLRFRYVRAKNHLPAAPSRLWGAPVTTCLAILALATLLVATGFIDGLTWAWKGGIPFFAILIIVFLIIDRRRKGTLDTAYDPLKDELARREQPAPDAAQQAQAASD